MLTKSELTKQWIKEWWPEFSELESDWRLGSGVNWRVADGKIGAHGKISIVEPYKLLRFSFKVDEPPQQEDVTYKLEEREGRTILSISIGDFGDCAEHEQCYPKAVESWDKSLLKIKEMAEPTL